MDFETSKKFDKLVYKIKDSSIKRRLKSIFAQVENADSLSDIPNLKPITRHPGFYILEKEINLPIKSFRKPL